MRYEDLGYYFWSFCKLSKTIGIKIDDLNKKDIDTIIKKIYKEISKHKRNEKIINSVFWIGVTVFLCSIIAPIIIYNFTNNSKIYYLILLGAFLSILLFFISTKLYKKLPTDLTLYSEEKVKDIEKVVKNNIKHLNEFLKIYNDLKEKDLKTTFNLFCKIKRNWVAYRYKNKKKKTKTYKIINK